MNSYLRWREAFASALDTRFYSLEFLDALMNTGHAGCWASDTAAIVAVDKVFPTGVRAVVGVVAVGELEEIVKLIPLAEQWGKANGCQFGMIESTAGWQRVMKKHGYETFQVSLIKEL